MRKLVFLPVVFLLSIFVSAQPELDALFTQLENAKSDEEKCDLLNEIALFTINIDPDQSLNYAKKAKELAEKINYKKGLGFAYYNFGNVNYYLDEYEEGIKNLEEARKNFEEVKDEKGLGYVCNTTGEIRTLEGKYEEALSALFEGLDHFEKANDNVGLSRVNNSIGIIHHHQKNYEEALKYFNQALATADEPRKGDASLWIGRVYVEQSKYSEAERYLNDALKIGEKNEDNYIISDCYYLLGRIDAFYGENEKALDYYKKCIEIKNELEDSQGIALASIHTGKLYLSAKNATEALSYFRKAKLIANEIGIKEELKDAYLGMSNSFNYLKKFDSAYFYLDSHNKIYEELLSEDASKKLAQLEASLAAQKREDEIAMQKKLDEAKADAEKQMHENEKKMIFWISVAVIVILLGLAWVFYNRYKQKQKANEQLEKFNREIKEQRDIIEEKNRDIMDSIRYAKRIQTAILPAHEMMDEHLNEYFVLYKPKDIVSGDFYWAQMAEERNSKKILFAAVDCTGHGVPGAFVSIVGFNGLNRAVKEFRLNQPSLILDRLNAIVEETFRHHGKDGEDIKDGMDISLCSLEYKDKNTATVQWAGANNPLWVVRKGQGDRGQGDKGQGQENSDEKKNNSSIVTHQSSPITDTSLFTEIKADKQPIGAYLDRKPFSNHTFELVKGDTLYIFTDGYADQFGGEKGKKFKYTSMRDLLLSVQHLPMKEQREKLNDTIDAWMHNSFEQIDDMCIIGVRV